MTIKTPTTFVIGAGASRAYGLPAGAELRQRATVLNSNSDVFQFVASALQTHSIGSQQLNDFRDDLKQHPEDSIDAFLEKRRSQPVTLHIGKRVIAGLLAESLVRSNPCPPEQEDWLLHVVRKMLAGAPTATSFVERNAKVQFVTFNFDTFIERRVSELIRASYPSENIETAVESCPVIHIHGRVGCLPNVNGTHTLGRRTTGLGGSMKRHKKYTSRRTTSLTKH